MKVLQINSVCGYGSTGRIVTDLADTIIKNNDDCQIVFSRHKAPNRYQNISHSISSTPGFLYHLMKTRLFDSHGFESKRATLNLLRYIENYAPDIIHIHNLHGYYLNIELLFSYLKSLSTPIIWTLHDCWAFTGHCAYFTAVNCTQWKTGCTVCPALKAYPKCILKGNVSKNYQRKREIISSLNNITIVTPSFWLAQIVQASFLNKYPTYTIPNGIDLNIFKPTVSNFRQKYSLEDKIIILGVANKWEPRKGLNDFIELANLLEKNYQIVLVGLSKNQTKNLPFNILPISRTNSPHELAGIYSSADFFVNASHEDNYPTVLLESQACGTPVITYNVGGSAESIISGTGTITKEGATHLYEAIINSNFNRKKCIMHSTEFDKQATYKKYIQLYQTLS